MNNIWAKRKEMMAQTNRGTHLDECDNEIPTNHQSANGHLRTPQAMLQRPQNHVMGVNNFTQGINLIFILKLSCLKKIFCVERIFHFILLLLF
jgi:hypothetical protein